MNGAANCLYAICCPPDSEAQFAALRTEFEKAFGDLVGSDLDKPAEHYAARAAKFVLKHFDLAPKGSLQPFKDEIARLARENA